MPYTVIDLTALAARFDELAAETEAQEQLAEAAGAHKQQLTELALAAGLLRHFADSLEAW